MARATRASAENRSMSQVVVLDAFSRALALETHNLGKDPSLLFQQLQNRLQWEGDEVRASLDRKAAAAPSRRRTVIRLKTQLRESRALVQTIEAHAGDANDCAISPHGEYVVSVGADGQARQWDTRSGREIQAVFIGPPREASTPELKGGATCCAISPDGFFVLCGGANGSVKAWDPSTGRELWSLDDSGYTLYACCVLPDASQVAWARVDEEGAHFGFHGTPLDSVVRIRDASGDMRSVKVKGHARACSASPDGKLMALAVHDNAYEGHRVEMRNVRTGNPLWKAKHPAPTSTVLDSGLKAEFAPEICDCAFTPDGAFAVTAGRDSTLRLWNPRSGTALRELGRQTPGWSGFGSGEAAASESTACAVTPDGEAVLSGSLGGALTLWELATGAAIATLEGHGGEVTACAVASDGRFAVSSSRDGTVRIWDLDVARGG